MPHHPRAGRALAIAVLAALSIACAGIAVGVLVVTTRAASGHAVASTPAASDDAIAGTSTALYGTLPTQLFQDGSIGVDPNKLGIGPAGVTTHEPTREEALRDLFDRLPDDQKISLDGGRVIGIITMCGLPHDPELDPAARCLGLHDLKVNAVLSLDQHGDVMGVLEGDPNVRRLFDLAADPDIHARLVSLLANAQVRDD